MQLSISRSESSVREEAWMTEPFPVDSVTSFARRLIRAFTVPLSAMNGDGRVADPIRIVDNWKLPEVTRNTEEDGLESNVKWRSSKRTPAETLAKLIKNVGVSELTGFVTRAYVVELML